ncbi:MAG: hypothetical protein HY660_13840 [Armatimonadetes bacterium]|nr:hypothetical protein [Armatimonadota bacterium]
MRSVRIIVWALVLALAVATAGFSQQSTRPTNLASYGYRVLTNARINLYMDNWGRGYVFDGNKKLWFRIPEVQVLNRIQPAYAKVSNTMALIYAADIPVVYDTSRPNDSPWVYNNEVRSPRNPWYSFSRSRDANWVAQANDNLALAAATNWITVYDYTLHRWVNVERGADDSTGDLPRNFVLTPTTVTAKSLNGPFFVYTLGSGRWTSR